MSSQIETSKSPNNDRNADLKNWVMIILTLTFILLYILALTGKLESLKEWEMVTRLEPIIFVLIGYYFGRLPAQQNEKTLRDEIYRQTNKADAAQYAKEQALQVRESLEEKVKNVKVVLASPSSPVLSKQLDRDFNNNAINKEDYIKTSSISTAIIILDS